MAAQLNANLATIKDVTSFDIMPEGSTWIYNVKAIAEEQIPPHTINIIKVWIKAVNMRFTIMANLELAMRWLMIAGWAIDIQSEEDEIIEVEIPVYNLTNENVNIRVWDNICNIYSTNADDVIELPESEWNAWEGEDIHDTVTITVTDWTDPIAGVSVSIDGWTAWTTDNSWEVTFSNILAKTHTITATKTGYEDFSDEVDLSSDDEAEIEMSEVE